MEEAKAQSQGKLVNRLMATIGATATALTTLEVVGALEVAKAMVLDASRNQMQPAPKPQPQIVVTQ